MDSKHGLQMGLEKLIYGGLGIFAGMICILGIYPLVPSYFAAYCLKKKRYFSVFLGCMIGVVAFMPFQDVVKYGFILIIIYLAINFYVWANRKCSGWIGGGMAAIVTIVMNCFGKSMMSVDQRELALGVAEGLMVLGLTVLIHYTDEMLQYGMRAVRWRMEEKYQNQFVEDMNLERTSGTDSHRVESLVSAVNSLSKAFQRTDPWKEKTMFEYASNLEREVTGRVCMDCEGCALCWTETYAPLTDGIRRMLYEVIAHRSREEILESGFGEACPNYQGMVEAAMEAFGTMELNEAWYRRLLENRQVVAQQLDAMTEVLKEWTKKRSTKDHTYWKLLAKIGFETKERGIVVDKLHIYEDEKGKFSIRAKVEGKWGGGIPMSQYLYAVERGTGWNLRLEKDAKSIITKEPVDVVLYEDTAFYALPGIAKWKKDGSTISGDNFVMFEGDDGQYHVCLSDGMGSGGEACRESEFVVDLFQKMIEAGFGKENAVKMMNAAMVLQGNQESYSTLDYASVDMYTGEMEVMKIGGAASFVKSNGNVEYVVGESLPAGVDIHQEIPVWRRSLEAGDFLVMVTDGVLEYLCSQNQEDGLCEIINSIETDNAGVMAQKILDKVLAITRGIALDDMTVLVIGFWRK